LVIAWVAKPWPICVQAGHLSLSVRPARSAVCPRRDGLALLIGGAVVTETVFAIPGIGRLTVDAILRRDYPVIQGIVLLFSFVYVLVNLLIDLLYTVLDPRIRY
jgi:ABC-type antimicrobial peptide transport system permease subunit